MNSPLLRRLSLNLALLAVAFVPSSLHAQSELNVVPADTSALSASIAPIRVAPASHSASEAVASGPRMRPTALMPASRTETRDRLPAPRDPGENVGSNLALMGVGAAAVAAGLLIGDDGGHALALGGAVVGLVGLYRYMR